MGDVRKTWSITPHFSWPTSFPSNWLYQISFFSCVRFVFIANKPKLFCLWTDYPHFQYQSTLMQGKYFIEIRFPSVIFLEYYIVLNRQKNRHIKIDSKSRVKNIVYSCSDLKEICRHVTLTITKPTYTHIIFDATTLTNWQYIQKRWSESAGALRGGYWKIFSYM